MPILKVLDLEQIKAAALASTSTSHSLSPETVQLCLALLSGAKKYYAWEPKLDVFELQEAQGMIEMAIAEITVGV